MLAEGPTEPYMDGWVLSKMLRAAERLGWKLTPRTANPDMLIEVALRNPRVPDIWRAMWDRAPCMGRE